MKILNPPQNYIDYRCAIHGKDGEDFTEARKKFYKGFPCEEEIKQCFHWLRTSRYEMTLPIERIEIREDDFKKHGRVASMMIYDIEYWRESGQIKCKKIYIPIERLVDYEYIRTMSMDAWRKKGWPTTKNWEEMKPELSGEEAEEFERKREIVKQQYRLPYKDDSEVPF